MLKLSYEKAEDIPEKYRDLYEEKDGNFVLIKIEGMKTGEDVARLQTALDKERKDHKATKDKLKPYLDIGAPDEVQAKLDKLPELEAIAEGKVDDAKINQLVETRIKARMAPIERENKQLKEKNGELEGQVKELGGKIFKTSLESHIRGIAEKLKVVPTAIDDIVMYGERIFEQTEDGKFVTKDGVGVTPGLSPEMWLQDQQKSRPHWWPASQSGGAGGGGGGRTIHGVDKNPWSKEHWNLTEQGRLVRELGTEKAAEVAKTAGSFIGATSPAAPKK